MNRISKFVIGTALAVSVAATGLYAPTEAAELDLTKQHEMLLQQINQVQTQLVQKQKEESKALLELRKLNNTLNSTEKKLRSTEITLTSTERELASLEKELQTTELELGENSETLKERLRTYYVQGDIHYLEVLFNSASFSDLLTRWDLLGRIAKNDAALIDQMKKKVQLYQDNLKLALEKKETLASLRLEQDERKHDLHIASSRQKEVLQELSSEKQNIEAALDELQAESDRIAVSILKKTGADTSKYLGSGKMAWPTPGYSRITSPYGWRRHPILKRNKLHTGVDIGAANGSSIKAAEQGVVLEVGWRGAYGRVVIINHGGNIVSLYAHTSQTLVNEGEIVAKGQEIARVGSTGMSTGPHLHFEVRKNGAHVNPMSYLK